MAIPLSEIKATLSAKDPVLATIIDQVDFPQVSGSGDVFSDLMGCVIEQQIIYRSTKRTFQKMLERADLASLTLENWEKFEELGLGQAKLSTSKFETMARVLDFFSQHQLDWQRLSDDEVRAQLGSIKGIGKWTMDMILIYTLGRPDVVPLDDYHLKMLLPQLYGLDAKKRLKAQMREVSEEWMPYRSYAVQYLLAWKSQQKKRRER